MYTDSEFLKVKNIYESFRAKCTKNQDVQSHIKNMGRNVQLSKYTDFLKGIVVKNTQWIS